MRPRWGRQLRGDSGFQWTPSWQNRHVKSHWNNSQHEHSRWESLPYEPAWLEASTAKEAEAEIKGLIKMFKKKAMQEKKSVQGGRKYSRELLMKAWLASKRGQQEAAKPLEPGLISGTTLPQAMQRPSSKREEPGCVEMDPEALCFLPCIGLISDEKFHQMVANPYLLLPKYSLPGLQVLEARGLSAVQLDGVACSQIEHYFSPENLYHDQYLRSLMDEDGWVSLADIVSFPRMRRLGLDSARAAAALANSNKVEVLGGSASKVRLRPSVSWHMAVPAQVNGGMHTIERTSF